MLARRKAFEGTSAFTVIAAIMSGEPPPIAALQSLHPLLDVVRRCIEKDRERRWQNIRDVTGELRWIVDQPIPTAAATAARPRRVWRVAIPAALVLATVAAAAGVRALRVRGVTPQYVGGSGDLRAENIRILRVLETMTFSSSMDCMTASRSVSYERCHRTRIPRRPRTSVECSPSDTAR
jgi:hypothetical protein